MSPASARGLSASEQDRAFLQRRVALFGLLVGDGYLFFWLYRAVLCLATGHPEEFIEPSFLWHFVATVCFLMLWVVNRTGKRSRRFVRTSELVALSLGVLATGAMALFIEPEDRPDFILLLALYNVILGRAIFVPSTGRWTFSVGFVVGVLLFISVYVGWLRADTSGWEAIYPEILELSREQVALAVATEIGVWWALAIMMSTSASVVIYGLRRQIRKAEQLGQYRLEEKLGEGGMGVVYRARHAFLRRPTAIKLLPPEKAGVENLRRFEQEVQMTASLSHPNTITIFDYGHTADGLFYYAMEYIDGLSLSDVVARSGAQPEHRVVHLMRQAASALIEAHGIGLVHRDIKPSNLMVQLLHPHRGGGDFVKVLDFGLVKAVRQDGRIELTNEAHLAGTPQYMAPESLVSPDEIDGRADLYALGAVAYYLLTGTHVFSGRNIVEVSSHHLHTEPESPSARLGRELFVELESLVLQLLEKNPGKRLQTAYELELALAEIDLPPWTCNDAQRWWKEHGGRDATSSPTTLGGALTVEITSRGTSDRA